MSPLCTVLAIDGGGTKTAAAVAESAADGQLRLLGEGLAGPSNPLAVGMEAAVAALQEAIGKAFHEAGGEPPHVSAAVIAMAGSDREPIRTLLWNWAAGRALADRVEVVTDAAPVLRAGSSQGWGVALIAGTGSLAWGRSTTGETARAGGWGYLCGDEGSGFALAQAGIRAALSADEDRGPATSLADRLVVAAGVANLAALVRWIYAADIPRVAVAALAPIVATAAAEGDTVAQALLHEAGRELAQLVASVACRLQMQDDAFPLAGAGGLLTSSQELRESLCGALDAGPAARAELTLVASPLQGALQLAADLARSS